MAESSRGRSSARRGARRLALCAAVTGASLLAAEWALFGLGGFWRLEPLGDAMPARWGEAMRVGAYAGQLRRNPPTEPRLIAIGSSVMKAGFDPEAFGAAWAAEAGTGSLDVFAAPLSGCSLVEGMMLSQVLADPPPAYVLLGMARRDVMPVMPESLMLSAQAFHVPRVLPSRSQAGNAEPETRAQRVWRRWWPGYQHRILMQQLTVHYRPGLRGDEAADARRGFKDADTVVQDGRDIPLLAPWADWCRSRRIQPILVMMPTLARQRAADALADAPPGYRERCETVARASGIWFVDATEAMPDALFADGIHLTPAGARRFAPVLAARVAAYARGDATQP